MAFGNLGGIFSGAFNQTRQVELQKKQFRQQQLQAQQERFDNNMQIATEQIASVRQNVISPEKQAEAQKFLDLQIEEAMKLIKSAEASRLITPERSVLEQNRIAAANLTPWAHEKQAQEVKQAGLQSQAQAEGTVRGQQQAKKVESVSSGIAMTEDGKEIGAVIVKGPGGFEVQDLQGNKINAVRFLSQSQQATTRADAGGFDRGMSAIATQFIEQQSSLATVMSIAEDTIDIVQSSDTVIGALGNTLQGLNSLLEQTKNTIGVFIDKNTGKPTLGVFDDTRTKDGGSLFENSDRFDFGQLSQTAINNAAVRSNLLTIAALNARAFEPGARQLSDADIQRQLTILGTGGSKAVLVNNLKKMVTNSVNSYKEKVTAFNQIGKVLGDVNEIEISKDILKRAEAFATGSESRASQQNQQNKTQPAAAPKPHPDARQDVNGVWWRPDPNNPGKWLKAQ